MDRLRLSPEGFTAYKIDYSAVGRLTRNSFYLFEMISRGERI
jgi:hypothetical protein